MERWRTVAWGPEREGEGPGRCPCDTLGTCFLQTPPGRSETHQGEAIAGESLGHRESGVRCPVAGSAQDVVDRAAEDLG